MHKIKINYRTNHKVFLSKNSSRSFLSIASSSFSSLPLSFSLSLPLITFLFPLSYLSSFSALIFQIPWTGSNRNRKEEWIHGLCILLCSGSCEDQFSLCYSFRSSWCSFMSHVSILSFSLFLPLIISLFLSRSLSIAFPTLFSRLNSQIFSHQKS